MANLPTGQNLLSSFAPGALPAQLAPGAPGSVVLPPILAPRTRKTTQKAAKPSTPAELAATMMGSQAVPPGVPIPDVIAESKKNAEAASAQEAAFTNQLAPLQNLYLQMTQAQPIAAPTAPAPPNANSKQNMYSDLGTAIGALFSRGSGLGGAYAQQMPYRQAQQQSEFANAEQQYKDQEMVYQDQLAAREKQMAGVETAMRNAATGAAAAGTLQEHYVDEQRKAIDDHEKALDRERKLRLQAGNLAENIKRYTDSDNRARDRLGLGRLHEADTNAVAQGRLGVERQRLSDTMAIAANRNATTLIASGMRVTSAYDVAQMNNTYKMVMQTVRDKAAMDRLEKRDDDQSKFLAARLQDNDFRAQLAAVGKIMAPLDDPKMQASDRAKLAKDLQTQIDTPGSPYNTVMSELKNMGVYGDSISETIQAKIQAEEDAGGVSTTAGGTGGTAPAVNVNINTSGLPAGPTGPGVAIAPLQPGAAPANVQDILKRYHLNSAVPTRPRFDPNTGLPLPQETTTPAPHRTSPTPAANHTPALAAPHVPAPVSSATPTAKHPLGGGFGPESDHTTATKPDPQVESAAAAIGPYFHRLVSSGVNPQDAWNRLVPGIKDDKTGQPARPEEIEAIRQRVMGGGASAQPPKPLARPTPPPSMVPQGLPPGV